MFEMFFKSTARSTSNWEFSSVFRAWWPGDIGRSTENIYGEHNGWLSSLLFSPFFSFIRLIPLPLEDFVATGAKTGGVEAGCYPGGSRRTVPKLRDIWTLETQSHGFFHHFKAPSLALAAAGRIGSSKSYWSGHIFGKPCVSWKAFPWIGSWLQRFQKERGVGLMLQGFAPWSWWIRFPWILSSLLGLVDKLEMSALKIIGLEGQMPLMPFSLNLKYLSILMPTITIYPCNPRNVGYFKAQSCGCRCHRCGTLLFDGCLRVTRCPSGLLPCRQGTSKNYEKNTGKLVWNSISARPKSIVQPWHCPVWVLLHISLILTYIHKYTPSIHQTFIWIHTVPHTCVLVDAYTTEGTFVVQHWEASWFFPHYTPSSINPALSPCFSSSLPWSFFDDLSWTWKIQFD